MTGTMQEGQGEPGKNFVSSREVHQLLHIMPTVAKHGVTQDQMDVAWDVLTPVRKSVLRWQSPWRSGRSFPRTKKQRHVSGGRKADKNSRAISEPSSLALPSPGAGSGAVSGGRGGSTVHFVPASAGCSAEASAAGEPGHPWQKAGAASTAAYRGNPPWQNTMTATARSRSFVI